jgi:hypothetical protein
MSPSTASCIALVSQYSPISFFIIIIIIVVLELELRAYTLNYSTSPFFLRVFQDGVFQTIFPGWLRTEILLISPPDLLSS